MKKAALIFALVLISAQAHAQAVTKLPGFPCTTSGETSLSEDEVNIIACLRVSATDATLRWKATTMSAGYVVGRTAATPANNTLNGLICYGQVNAQGQPMVRLKWSNDYDSGFKVGEYAELAPTDHTSNGIVYVNAICTLSPEGVTGSLAGYSARVLGDKTGNPDKQIKTAWAGWQ